MQAITAAIIAASATLITAFLTQFLAERYRRFNDGAALAAGFLGELTTYHRDYSSILQNFQSTHISIKEGKRAQIKFRAYRMTEDRFFEASLGKLGLLGPDLAKRLLFIYSNLEDLRTVLTLINNEQADMDDAELGYRIDQCIKRLQPAVIEMDSTLPVLDRRCKEKFCFFCLS